MEGLPSGPVRLEIDAAAAPASEGLSLVEGFRGDILASVRFGDGGLLARCHLRDPSWFQWPVLEVAIEDNIVADFPVCNKSFNCSYSGHDLKGAPCVQLLFEGLGTAPSPPPRPVGRGGARRAGSGRRSRRPSTARPQPVHPRGRCGSCNGCELEIHTLNNAFYDLERFGLRFVASPRHADVLLVTGPVTTNMRAALERTYEATPDPEWVVGSAIAPSTAVSSPGAMPSRRSRPSWA